MVETFALKLDSSLNEACYRYLIDKTTADKKADIVRFLKKDDAYRGLFAEFLARYTISKYSEIKNEHISFSYSSYGKPFLAGIDNLHFNVSHSGEWVVCAVSSKSVGIDIELISPIDIGISEKHFSTAEHNDLLQKKGTEQLHYFYDLWTLKESYIKQQGLGLSIPLGSFTIQVHPEKGITIQFNEPQNEKLFFKQHNIDDSYKLAVCSNVNFFDEIKFVTLSEIMNFF